MARVTTEALEVVWSVVERSAAEPEAEPEAEQRGGASGRRSGAGGGAARLERRMSVASRVNNLSSFFTCSLIPYP